MEWLLIVMLDLQTNPGVKVEAAKIEHSLTLERFATVEDCLKIGNLIEQEYINRGGGQDDLTIKCEDVKKL